jgi:hypothetical protein
MVSAKKLHMSSKYLLYSLIIFLSTECIGQNVKLAGRVVNDKTKLAIPYASGFLVHQKKYFDANDNGQYSILADQSDSVSFACIGFQSRLFSVQELISANQISLQESVNTLEEVVVRKEVAERVGIVNEKQTTSFVGSANNNYYEIVSLIKIADTSKRGVIKNVLFKQKRFDADRPMRLHLYDVNENGYPGVELLNRDVIINKDNFNKGYLTIDVGDQNIVINGKAFFVGLEWITPVNTEIRKRGFIPDTGIGETTKLSSIYSYHRSIKISNEWYTYYENGIEVSPGVMEMFGGKDPRQRGNPRNMLASVDVIFF